MKNTKKVYIGIPTSYKAKGYCEQVFFINLMMLAKASDVQLMIRVFDNTYLPGNSGYNYELNEHFSNEGIDFKYQYIHPTKPITNIHSILSYTHNLIRKDFIKSGFDFLLHLESDVIPSWETLNILLSRQKKVIGAVYQINFADHNQAMITNVEKFGETRHSVALNSPYDAVLIDGKVKKVHHCGLGCVLIHKSVFEKGIEFRYMEGENMPPDSFFYADLDSKGIPVYVDTSLVCEHLSLSWRENKKTTI